MKCRRKNVSGVSPSDVTVYAVRCFAALGSASVFVIVVGNYFVAAFYEASGASTCNHGFQHPRRNQCAPDWIGAFADAGRKDHVSAAAGGTVIKYA